MKYPGIQSLKFLVLSSIEITVDELKINTYMALMRKEGVSAVLIIHQTIQITGLMSEGLMININIKAPGGLANHSAREEGDMR